MKKIINGKMYNTETAESMGEFWNGLGRSDFDNLTETLYRKKTGEFFLHGEGGPKTQYAERCGSGYSSGEEIIPFTYDEARIWAEKSLDADDYEKIFGEVSEDESKVAVTLSLASGVYEAAKREASKAGISISAYIEQKIKE